MRRPENVRTDQLIRDAHTTQRVFATITSHANSVCGVTPAVFALMRSNMWMLTSPVLFIKCSFTGAVSVTA